MAHSLKVNRENEFCRLINQLESAKEFIEWREKNTEAFLSYIFMMFDEANTGSYQIGYYNTNSNEITTFIVDAAAKILGVNATAGADILKAEPNILELKIKNVKYGSQQILELAKKFQLEKYPQFKVLKSFVILQNLSVGQVFNFTFLSLSFETLNIRISSDEGKVVATDLKTLMNILK